MRAPVFYVKSKLDTKTLLTSPVSVTLKDRILSYGLVITLSAI